MPVRGMRTKADMRPRAQKLATPAGQVEMAEYKNGKLQLPQVTLCAMTSVNIPETIKAIRYSMQGIDFGDVVLITHKKPWNLPKEIRFS